jgi:hypothetical protein
MAAINIYRIQPPYRLHTTRKQDKFPVYRKLYKIRQNDGREYLNTGFVQGKNRKGNAGINGR